MNSLLIITKIVLIGINTCNIDDGSKIHSGKPPIMEKRLMGIAVILLISSPNITAQ